MTCVSGGALKAARAAGIAIDPAPRARATITRPARMSRAHAFDLIAGLLDFRVTFRTCWRAAVPEPGRKAFPPPQRSSQMLTTRMGQSFDGGRGFPFKWREHEARHDAAPASAPLRPARGPSAPVPL